MLAAPTRPRAHPYLQMALAREADRLYRDLFEERRGRDYVTLAEHPDGSATLQVLGGGRFERTPDGFVAYRPPWESATTFGFPMWFSGSRFVHSLLRAWKDQVVDALAERLDPLLPHVPEAVLGAAPGDAVLGDYREHVALEGWKVARALIGYADGAKRTRLLVAGIRGLVDRDRYDLLLRHAPRPGGFDSETYNGLVELRDPAALAPGVLSAYLALAQRADERAPARSVTCEQAEARVRAVLDVNEGDASWAYLLRLPASVAQRVAHAFYGNPTAARALLEVLSATGRVPRCSVVPEVLRRIYTRSRDEEGFDRAAFTRFVDDLLRATEKRRGLRVYLARLPHDEDRLPDAIEGGRKVTPATPNPF